jgi:hypothetical protein
MMFGMDPKKKALQELMSHLDMKDGKDLGAAMKPKAGIEVTKIENLGPGHTEPDADTSPGMSADGGDKPKMSDDELQELIEAIQSKLGAA